MSDLLSILAFLLIAFLVCREIACWYWKLNDVVRLLTDIRDNLDDIKRWNGIDE